jgi:hypothetical protein
MYKYIQKISRVLLVLRVVKYVASKVSSYKYIQKISRVSYLHISSYFTSYILYCTY